MLGLTSPPPRRAAPPPPPAAAATVRDQHPIEPVAPSSPKTTVPERPGSNRGSVKFVNSSMFEKSFLAPLTDSLDSTEVMSAVRKLKDRQGVSRPEESHIRARSNTFGPMITPTASSESFSTAIPLELLKDPLEEILSTPSVAPISASSGPSRNQAFYPGTDFAMKRGRTVAVTATGDDVHAPPVVGLVSGSLPVVMAATAVQQTGKYSPQVMSARSYTRSPASPPGPSPSSAIAVPAPPPAAAAPVPAVTAAPAPSAAKAPPALQEKPLPVPQHSPKPSGTFGSYSSSTSVPSPSFQPFSSTAKVSTPVLAPASTRGSAGGLELLSLSSAFSPVGAVGSGTGLGTVLEKTEERLHTLERTVTEARLGLMDCQHMLEQIGKDQDTVLLRLRQTDAGLPSGKDRLRAAQALDHVVDRIDATVAGITSELRRDTDKLANVLRRIRTMLSPPDAAELPPRRSHSPARRRSRSRSSASASQDTGY